MIIIYWLGFFLIMGLIALIVMLIQIKEDNIRYKKALKRIKDAYTEARISNIKGGEPWKN